MTDSTMYQKVGEEVPCHEHALMGLVKGCFACDRHKRWKYEPVEPDTVITTDGTAPVFIGLDAGTYLVFEVREADDGAL